MEKLTEFMMKKQDLIYLSLNKVEQFEKSAHKDNEWRIIYDLQKECFKYGDCHCVCRFVCCGCVLLCAEIFLLQFCSCLVELWADQFCCLSQQYCLRQAIFCFRIRTQNDIGQIQVYHIVCQNEKSSVSGCMTWNIRISI